LKLVTIARLLRARGNKGELAALPLSARLAEVTHVIVNDAPMEVEHTWTHGDRVIFKFKGVDTITDAERLAGADVSIPLEERPAASEGEYYQSDLIGCQVVDQTGRTLGNVQYFQETGGVPLLEIRTQAGKELLIPFAKAMLTNIDLEHKRIDVNIPAGLLDLN
jgi:16S rRNA processing protein RimM